MNAKNPKHTSTQSIDLEIEHPEFGWIPFTASPNDVELLGRELYKKAIDGAFGAISAYEKPLAHVNTMEQNKAEAIKRLSATDWVNQPDVYDQSNEPHLTNREDFLSYRANVRCIAVSPAAGNLDWPTEPTATWS